MNFINLELPYADAYDIGDEKIAMYINTTESNPIVNKPPVSTFSIYPNPTDGMVILDFGLNREIEKQVTIYSLTGDLVYEQLTDKDLLDLDVSNLINGVYIVKINYLNPDLTAQVQRLMISK